MGMRKRVGALRIVTFPSMSAALLWQTAASLGAAFGRPLFCPAYFICRLAEAIVALPYGGLRPASLAMSKRDWRYTALAWLNVLNPSCP